VHVVQVPRASARRGGPSHWHWGCRRWRGGLRGQRRCRATLLAVAPFLARNGRGSLESRCRRSSRPSCTGCRLGLGLRLQLRWPLERRTRRSRFASRCPRVGTPPWRGCGHRRCTRRGVRPAVGRIPRVQLLLQTRGSRLAQFSRRSMAARRGRRGRRHSALWRWAPSDTARVTVMRAPGARCGPSARR
jgi:hypothetical protein